MSLLEALGYVGDTIGKPGRAVRGMLAGRPDELLNLIPFSDTMGMTDPSQQVRGRDLLQQWGMQNEGDDSFGSHLAGFGVDVATDPLTWAGGALLAGGAKMLGRTNIPRVGAVAGSDAANGIFPLTDPINRLAPHTAEAMAGGNDDLIRRLLAPESARLEQNVADRATSPWGAGTPRGGLDLGDLAPMDVPAPGGQTWAGIHQAREAARAPITEAFPPDQYGYWLRHGPGYQEAAEKYNLPGMWTSSYPTEMADDGLKFDAMRMHIQKWDEALNDLNRLTPEAKATLGFPNNVDEFELGLQQEIAQLSPHAAPWQALLGLRHAELGPMRELAVRNVLPGQFADDLARQREMIEPLLDRWSPDSPLANKMISLLDEGRVMPSDAGELVHGGIDIGKGWQPGVLGHLPVDERQLRALAASRQRESILEELTGEIDQFGGRYGGLNINDLSQEAPSSQMADSLARILDTSSWHGRGYEGGVFNQVVRQPEQFAGEYADMIRQARELLPQLQARAAASADPAVAAQLGELVAGIRGNLSATAPFSSAIERATGSNHMAPLIERLNLGYPDALELAKRRLPEADAGMLEYLMRHHWNPWVPPATA